MIEPGSSRAEELLREGHILADAAEWDLALEAYNSTIALDPTLVGAFYGRGKLLYNLNQTDAAIADFGRVIELDPKFSEAYAARGYILAQLGSAQAAIADFSKALALLGAPTDPLQYVRMWGLIAARAEAHAECGDLHNAIAAFDQLVEANPNIWNFYAKRGALLDRLGEREKASADFATAERLCNATGGTVLSTGNPRSRS
jgi:Flp pilus assembly protein TadD